MNPLANPFRPFLVVGLLCLFIADATRAQTGGALGECVRDALAEHAEGRHFMSLAEGPNGLIVETASGSWGEPLGASEVLEVNCDSGSVQRLQLAGVPEVSDPWFDPATNRLYFTARKAATGATPGDHDIWVTAFEGGRWLQPWRLPAPINSNSDEFSPVSRDGRLWFASSRNGVNGELFVAESVGNAWQIEPLPTGINSPAGEWNLWVSSGEDVVIFESSGRESAIYGAGDLYGSVKDSFGRWRPAVRLASINNVTSDLNPVVIGAWMVHASVSVENGLLEPVFTPYSSVRDELASAFRFRMVVANRSSHSVSIIDLESGRAVQEFPTDRGPHMASRSRTGRHVAVPAYGIYPRPHSDPIRSSPGWVTEVGGEVLLWTPATGRVRQFQSGCLRPHGSAWEDDEVLWISCEDREGILRVNTSPSNLSSQFFETTLAGAHVVVWDERRRQAVVSHTGEGGLWFQPASGEQGVFLPVGAGAEAVHLLPGTDEAVVSVGPENQVAVINLEKREVDRRFRPECNFPIDFAVDVSGRLWVSCMFNSRLVAIDTDSGEEQIRLDMGHAPIYIEPHPGQGVLYVSLPRQNSVVEVDLDTRAVTRSFDVGMEPDGLLVIGGNNRSGGGAGSP